MTTKTSSMESSVSQPAPKIVYRGWILRVFPRSNQLNILLRAVIGTIVILGLEYVIEVVWLNLEYWQRQTSFFTAPGVTLSAIGLLFSFILLGQWGARYVELWERVRPAFDVSDQQYDTMVRQNLKRMYERDHIPFLLFVGLQISVYGFFGSDLPAGFLHVGFLHFFGMAALYHFYRHTITISRITDLDLISVAQARPLLSDIADFSVIICLNWFGAIAALVVYLEVFMGFHRNVGLFYAMIVIAFVGIGLLVFIIPVMLLHEALELAKRDRLHAIYQDYEALFTAWSENDLEGEPSVALDILDQRRQNTENLSTWPYRLVSVGKIAAGSIVPTALSAIQVIVK